MRTLIPAVFVSALLGLTGCEPEGPASDIGDNIDEVMDNTASSAPPVQQATGAPASQPAKPEVIEQQKAQLEETVQEASQEAQERLDEILEHTLEP